MDEVIKIIGIGLVSLIIIIIIKQYKPEFAIYVSVLAGILILALVMDKFARNNRFNKIYNTKNNNKYRFYKFIN